MTRKKIPHGLKGSGNLFMPILTEDGKGINVKETERYTRWLVENGCHTIVPGSTCATLTEEERKLLWQTTAEAAGDEAAVMPYLGAHSSTIEEFIREVKLAEESGVNSLYFSIGTVVKACGYVILPWPKEYEEAVYKTLKAGFEATDLPVLLYNNAMGMPNIPVDFMVRLANEFDNFAGLKTNPFYQLPYEIKALKPFGINIAKGCDERQFVAALAMGCDGFIAPMGCGFPDKLDELYKAFLDGNLEKANEIEHEFITLVDIHYIEGGIWYFPLKKYLMEARGFDVGKDRSTELPLSRVYREKVDKLLKKMGIFKDAENYLR